MEGDSSPERKKYNKGGKILRYELTNCNEINASPFIKQCFEDVNCLDFYKRVCEVGFHEQLIDCVATHLKGESAIIAGVEFTFSVASISLATGIPDHGEYWFKGMKLDLVRYRSFLKTPYRETHTHIIPFRYLLEKYAPLMKVVMKFFTCEGRFSRLYAYHIWILMHFIAHKPLNICNYLCRSLSKMSEKVQVKNKENYPSLFHHSLIKTVVLHKLTEKNMTWDYFLEASLKWHESNVSVQHSNMPTRQMEVGSSRKSEEIPKAPRPEVTRMYKRGKRLVFTSHGKKGTKPSTSVKQGSPVQDKDLVEHEFELVDLEAENDPSSMQQIIKYKDTQIREIMDNMGRARFVISFLERENIQLKAKQLIMEKEQDKLLQQEDKGKAVSEIIEPKGTQQQGKKNRPRTRGLKKALKEEKNHIFLVEEIELEDRIA